MTLSHGRSRRIPRIAGLLVAVVCAGGLAGCAMFRKFNMTEIHQESAARQDRNPIIFIHGFIGSKFRNARTHETVWGRFVDAIKKNKSDDLTLPIDSLDFARNRDELVPYALYESVAGVKFYGALLDALRDVGGYRDGDISNPAPGDTLFVYNYDWRRDIVESAQGLGRAIQQIKARLHAPDTRFDIVAHSMGGLVAEYYLKFGTEDVLGRADPAVSWAGAPHLGRLILIGTPRRGTLSAFRTLNTGVSRTLSLATVFTMPSLYELLPSDGRVHIIDEQGNPLDIDLYDSENWVRNGWSVFNPRADAVRDRAGSDDARRAASKGREPGGAHVRLFLQAALDRARAFHRALAADPDGPAPVPVHLFGSDCIPTLDLAVLKRTSAGPVVLFNDESTPDREARQLSKVMLVPGDGTVTAGSLLGLDGAEYGAADRGSRSRSFASTFFFCETHGLLPANRGFQDNLFYVLFHSPERPAPVERAAGAQ